MQGNMYADGLSLSSACLVSGYEVRGLLVYGDFRKCSCEMVKVYWREVV